MIDFCVILKILFLDMCKCVYSVNDFVNVLSSNIKNAESEKKNDKMHSGILANGMQLIFD